MESRKVSYELYLDHGVIRTNHMHDAETMATVGSRVPVSRHRLPPYGDGTSPTTPSGTTSEARWAGATSRVRAATSSWGKALGIHRTYPLTPKPASFPLGNKPATPSDPSAAVRERGRVGTTPLSASQYVP